LNKDGFILAGSFGVDSGQAMVGDPCYLDQWIDNNRNGEKWEPEKYQGEFNYQGVSGVTLADNFGEIGRGTAVVFSTGYGDGYYPVYVKLNEDNRVVAVYIDFDGTFDEDE
jgi:hypothetical protein